MRLLYKFSVRNEQEIRNDLPARIIRVVADNIQDATCGFVDESSLIQSVEFVSPVIVVSSGFSSSSKSSDELVTVNICSLCHITYIDKENKKCSIFVHASDQFTAISRLQTYLGYSPVIDRSYMIEELII